VVCFVVSTSAFFGVIQGLHLFAFSSFVYELVSIFITFG
jgi:hypothetical protein